VHSLDIRIVGKSVFPNYKLFMSTGSLPKFATDTRLFESTEWQLMRQEVVTVDPDGTSLKSVTDFNGNIEILGVNTSSETVESIMSLGKDILSICEFTNGNDRSEDFFLHNLHLLIDFSEDGRLDEIAFLAVTFTTEDDLGSLVFAGFDIIHDTRELKFRDLRTLDGGCLEWIADLVLLCAFSESLDKFVVNAFLHIYSRTSAAALT